MSRAGQVEGVKSAARVLDILELLMQYPDGISLSEISQHLDIPKSSAHGLLATLLGRGYLRAGRQERTYRLGVRLFELGSGYIAGTDLLADGQQIVREMAHACEETVHLAILAGNEVLYVAKEEGSHTIRMVSAIGKRFPAYGTGVGKMLLAALTPEELDQLYPPAQPLTPITERTITDPIAFRQELARSRQRGYAVDLEESTPGLCCIAAPIFDSAATAVAAISVSVPSIRFTADHQASLLLLVQQGAERLSRILGHHPNHQRKP